MKNYWEMAKDVSIVTSHEIVGGFSMGFDSKIPEDVKNRLIHFVYWVEDHYNVPVTLWVDFRYRHYLLDQNKKRVSCNFYWVDFENYPVFEKEADIPVIELAVRCEKQTVEEILRTFIEGLTLYFAWLCNECAQNPDDDLTEEILLKYLTEENEHA